MRGVAEPFGLPPEEAIRWFREKGYSLDFDWRDIWREQHAQAFSVAKATRLDLLADIRAAVDDAISNGTSLHEFRKNLTPTLQSKGWWGKGEMVDPKTGELQTVQLGSPRRLRTIYETNLRQAMAAGRWERIERTAQRRPYLRYVALDDGNTRKKHLEWHNTILPWDHPWWKTHAPPNGRGCRCKVQQLSERDLARYGFRVSERAPRTNLIVYVNKRTGEVTKVPAGIDPSFDYNPGVVQRGGASLSKMTPLRNSQTRVTHRLDSSATWQPRGEPARWPAVHSAADEQLVRSLFRQMFGVQGERSTTIKDPTGLQVLVSESRLLDHLLQRSPKDPTKYKDPGRAKYVPRLRETIEDPEEIWMVPYRYTEGPEAGRVVMRMRYLARFGETKDGAQVLVAHRDPDGWLSWTLYPRAEVDKKREGYLIYKKRGVT